MIDNNPIFIDVDAVTGETTGTVYPPSQFQIKRFLTTSQKIDATRLMESLARGVERSPKILDLLSELAMLSFHIVKAPEWWGEKGLELLDDAPVWAVSAKVSEAQKQKT